MVAAGARKDSAAAPQGELRAMSAFKVYNAFQKFSSEYYKLPPCKTKSGEKQP